MDGKTFLALSLGFIVGFAGVFSGTKQALGRRGMQSPVTAAPDAGPSKGAPALNLKRTQQLLEEVKTNPRNYEALVELGNLNYDQRNFQAAVDFYRRALEVRPDAVHIRTDLGTALFYAERYDEAIAEIRKTLEISPTSPEALFNLGVVMLHGKNDPAAALELWEKLVATNPDFPRTPAVREQIEQLKKQIASPK